MAAALDYYTKSGRWWVSIFMAMPDHWHALVAFPRAESMANVIKDWKRYVAREGGIRWQDGFFDHRLRSGESTDEKWEYIMLNPVRKGFCKNPEDWPWVWPRPNL